MIVNYFAIGVPMGGWKESGIGFRHGEYGIKKYCRPESIVVTRFASQTRAALVPVHARPAVAWSAARRVPSTLATSNAASAFAADPPSRARWAGR